MNKKIQNSYWKNLWYGLKTSWNGLKISIRHFQKANKRNKPNKLRNKNYTEEKNGLVTFFYPYETLPIPDNARYRLYNEIEDCIVCDKCAKVCPVDCIEIEAIKATEQIGTTSDGSPIRLYAGKFDIDMAKCCYCGLCTTVCPTECLTMTKVYDYSEFDVTDMRYHFTNLSPEKAEEKKNLLIQFQKEKAEKIAASTPINTENNHQNEEKNKEDSNKKPIFRPKIKPIIKKEEE